LIILGVVVVLISAILMLWIGGEVNRPVYARRMVFNDEKFVRILNVIALILFISGLLLIALKSATASVGFAALIILIFLYIRYTGSAKVTYRTLRGAYKKIKKKYPEEYEVFYLFNVLRSRYPEWRPYQYDELLNDCNSLKDLTNNIIFIETGKVPDQSIYDE
jgi:ABC-type transport system involved in multi-copper enzyme maturation permease subunit